MSFQAPPNFKGDIVTPSSPDYSESIARWAKNAARKALFVFFVKDESDVALALNFARNNNLSVAIRGGGHSASGASSIEGGLVIDLSRYMNTCRVDEIDGKKVAYVGGGAIWETVDKEAIKFGLATVGGTINHTGVAGLTLGGGYGWLTPRHGLAIDNLVQATIVTASGATEICSASQNPDLFFAVRGGGCNFGVCTEFVLKLHEQRKTVFAGKLVFIPKPDLVENLIALTDEWLKNGPSENEGIGEMFTLTPDRHPCIIVILHYNGTETDGRAHFKKFFDLGPVMEDTKEIPYEELNALQNAFLGHGSNVYISATAHAFPSLAATSRALEQVIKLSQNPDAPTLTPAVVFEYLSLKKVLAISQKETAFRREPTMNVIFMFLWPGDEEGNDGKAFVLARDTAKTLTAIIHEGQGEKITEEQKLGYTNFDPEANSATKSDKAKAVFGANYPKLQAIKKKYDPEMVFNKWFPITPA